MRTARQVQEQPLIRLLLGLVEEHYRAVGAPSLNWLARYDQAMAAGPDVCSTDLLVLLGEQEARPDGLWKSDWLMRAGDAREFAAALARQEFPEQ